MKLTEERRAQREGEYALTIVGCIVLILVCLVYSLLTGG